MAQYNIESANLERLQLESHAQITRLNHSVTTRKENAL